MSSYALSVEFGGLSAQADRRFHRLLTLLALPALIAGIIIPFLHITDQLDKIVEPVERWVRMLPQAPAPRPEPEPAPAPKAEATPKPVLTEEQKVNRAKEKVSKFMRNFDALAELRDTTLPQVSQNLTAEIITSDTGARTLSQDLDKASGGIGETSAVDRNTSTQLGAYNTAAVQGPGGIGSGGVGRGGGRDKRIVMRTLEEIQLVFDRNKGSLYTMYQRERRAALDMAGKLVVRLTIAPSGRVTACTVVSSALQNPDFEKKVTDRVMLMDFGAKNVPEITIDYPIVFLPA